MSVAKGQLDICGKMSFWVRIVAFAGKLAFTRLSVARAGLGGPQLGCGYGARITDLTGLRALDNTIRTTAAARIERVSLGVGTLWRRGMTARQAKGMTNTEY